MPRKNNRTEMEDEAICQGCLEREMGNWFDEETSPEFVEMVNSTFDNLLHNGRCVICSKNIYMPLNSHPAWQAQFMFDAVSEQLEFAEYREELISQKENVFLN